MVYREKEDQWRVVCRKPGLNVNLGARAQALSMKAPISSRINSIGWPKDYSLKPPHSALGGVMMVNNWFVILSQPEGELKGDTVDLNFSNLMRNPSGKDPP